MNENLTDIIEAIVWLMVFIIWFMVTLWRKLRQEKKKEKSASASVPEVLERGDTQKIPKDKTRATSVRQIFGSLKGDLENFFEDIARMQNAEKQTSLPDKSEKTGKDIAGAAHGPDMPDDISEHIESVQTDVFESPKRTSRSPFRLKLSKKNLQQAVVYSEVLGPPVALRENDKTF
ncbi:hypothetical protein [Desulfonema magnum]|uniref:Uncharacterized protein n=1 Tax=Desulfonema magnum TaxID=45655 RepID=A0A975BHF6_9BACT|nr:hypothetical protein [Desulfonema magnum]QTA85431.1 Uncharacterized protein dnm_014410 [Desulfonema magnum]